MGRLLKRRLLEVKIAGKNIRCRECREYISKGTPYTFCTIRGFQGSYHSECFNKISVSLESEDTGEYKSNNSSKRLVLDTAKALKDIYERRDREKNLDIWINTGADLTPQ